MKLIVGLGNPGKKYEHTRHNLGFVVVDKLAENESHNNWKKFSTDSLTNELSVKQEKTILLKPQTFMNDSGKSVAEVAGFYKINPGDIWVIHDDFDLSLGEIRISYDSGAAGHRGVQSLIDILGSKNFWRFRVGLGRPTLPMETEDFVLQKFTTAEEKIITTSVEKTNELINQALNLGINKNLK